MLALPSLPSRTFPVWIPPPPHSPQAVFEECGKKGGVQLLLLPWAVLGLVFYVIGYPVLVVFVLWRYRYQMMEDQLLRAMGTGKTRLTNPHGACASWQDHPLRVY